MNTHEYRKHHAFLMYLIRVLAQRLMRASGEADDQQFAARAVEYADAHDVNRVGLRELIEMYTKEDVA